LANCRARFKTQHIRETTFYITELNELFPVK
jgi:hypothetical protein